jgi:hypothetical protein
MAEEGFKRKLTAILSADALGYSRLMEDDEGAMVKICLFNLIYKIQKFDTA